MDENIKVVIAADDSIFREGLRLALERESLIEVVGEAALGWQVLDVILESEPDIALLNIDSAQDEAIKVIPEIRENYPGTKVLVHTTSLNDALIFKALKAGAKGFLLKDEGIAELIKAIHVVHRGELWMERKLLARYFEGEHRTGSKAKNKIDCSKDLLTPREKEVLRILTTGCTNKEIAETLFISEKTVKCHLNSIFKKLEVSKRLQAILYAIKHGMQ